MAGGAVTTPFDPNVIVAGTVLAEFLDVSSPRLTQHANDGELPRNDRGGYPLREAIRAYVHWMRDEARRNTKSALATRVQEARAKAIEMDIAIKEGSLIDLEEATTRFEMLVGGMRAAMLGVPARVTKELTLCRQIEKEISAAFDEALQGFSEMSDDSAAP